MKRLLTIGLMLAAALALTNCVDQFETPIQENDIIVDETTTLQGEGEPFEVFVETAETKLDYDGNVYSWSTAIDKNGNEQKPDKIFLYSVASSGTSTSLQAHNEFTYIGGGKFVGNLAKGYTLPDENNWYGVYGYSSSAPTVTIGVNAEGSYTQKQMSNNSKRHLAGSGYPMYGVKKNVPKNKSPKFSMSHLSSIIALEIVNNGAGGDIVIKDAQIEATEEIVGDFTVDLLGASAPTFTKGSNVSKIARVELTNAATVTYGNSATLYLAVKPFDTSNKDLTISVNGSTRTVKMPANTVFRAGTVTTLRVPVETLTKPVISDAFDVRSEGRATSDNTHKIENVITTSAATTTEITVNGQNVDAYIIGQDKNNLGTVTITGFAQDLFKALPIGFYTSAWNSEPAVMKVKQIDVLLPVYDQEIESSSTYVYEKYYDIGDWGREKQRIKTETLTRKITIQFHNIKGRTSKFNIELFGKDTEMDLSIYDWMLSALGTKVAEKTTFSGMPPHGYYGEGDDHNIIVMNESWAYKEINTDNLSGFLVNFGDNVSMAGLTDMLNIPLDDMPTAPIVINEVLEIKYKYLSELNNTLIDKEYNVKSRSITPAWPGDLISTHSDLVTTVNALYSLFKTKTIDFTIASVDLVGARGVIPCEWALIYYLRDSKISVHLGTTADGPRMVFWGLDAMGPDKSPTNE